MACDGCELKLVKYLQICDDEEETEKFLFAHSVIPDEMKCPTCDSVVKINSLYFRCQRSCMINGTKRRCELYSSALQNTFFGDISVPIREVMEFVGYWVGLNSQYEQFLQSELGWSVDTTAHWGSVCREVTLNWSISKSEKIGGPDIIVEMDECRVGKRKYHKGRKIDDTWVFGGAESGNAKKFFFIPVPDREPETLFNLIIKYTHPGSLIYWKGYRCLQKEGLSDLKLNHSINFVGSESVLTWRNIRKNIPKYGFEDDLFVEYLSEYLFKKVHADFFIRYHEFFKAVASLYNGQKVSYWKKPPMWEDHVKGKCEMGEETEDMCKLCMDASLDCVLLECGHIATCIDCGKKLAECPICRQYVSRVVRTFKA